MRIRRSTAGLAVVLAFAAVGLTACINTSTASAQCGVVVGDGTDGHPRDIQRFIYPGQQTRKGDGEEVQFWPCGPRNYLVTPDGTKDANNNPVGDRHTPIVVWTKPTDGHPARKLNVWASAYWTPNEDPAAAKDFYKLCYKYRCYTTDQSQAGNANYSTPEWNGMLGENFGPKVDAAGQIAISGWNEPINGTAIPGYDDSIVRNRSAWGALGNQMSTAFMGEVRSTIGTENDIFCGSGTSFWPDASKPGEGKFKCSAVRFKIDRIDQDPADQTLDDEAARLAKEKANIQQRVQNAKDLYGPFWAQHLDQQDLIEACKDAKITCVIDFSGRVQVQTPARTG